MSFARACINVSTFNERTGSTWDDVFLFLFLFLMHPSLQMFTACIIFSVMIYRILLQLRLLAKEKERKKKKEKREKERVLKACLIFSLSLTSLATCSFL